MGQRWAQLTMNSLCLVALLIPQAASTQTRGNPPAGPAPDESFHFISGTFSRDIGPDGNTVIYTAPSGLVVIDTGRHPVHSQEILDYAASQGLPILAVINTHWHLDHTTGNLDIRAAYPEMKVYATRAIDGAIKGFLARSIAVSRKRVNDPSLDQDRRRRTRRFLDAIDQGALQPDIPVEAEVSLPVDNRDLELKVTHHAVTGSDIWVWDPATRTVIAGDIVTLPAPLFDTGCVKGWTTALNDIEEKPFERVVPGHGYILTAEEFHVYRKAFDHMIACAAEASGAECAEVWLHDAAPLLDKAAGADFADKDYAREAVTYYVDNIIKPPRRQIQECGGSE